MLKRLLDAIGSQKTFHSSARGIEKSQNATNPIVSSQSPLEVLASKFESAKDKSSKAAYLNTIRDSINQKPLSDVLGLMNSDIEIIRSLSSQVFAEVDSPNLYACMDKMLSDKSENLRLSCTEAMIYLSSPEYIKLLKKALSDKSPKVRIKAAIGLVDIVTMYENKDAIHILKTAANDSNEDVKDFITDELTLLGYETAVNKEEKELGEDEFKNIELFLAENLGNA